jgi:flavin-dependent dehydrogenase
MSDTYDVAIVGGGPAGASAAIFAARAGLRTAGDGARVVLNTISTRKGQRHVDHDVLVQTPATVH